ncbi:MAG: hypothetical protein AAFY38_02665 [Pseudomonadota bacterium]
MKHVFPLVLIAWAVAVAADSPEVLRAQIEAAGANARPGIERHAVQVDQCQMTTFWWRSDTEAPDEVLWSSFSFDMSVTTIVQPAKGGPSVAVPGGSAGGGDFVIIFFNAPDTARAQHERHILRPPSPDRDLTPSPRGDGTTHYFQPSNRFFFRHEGNGVIDKARRFVDAYTRYVEAHCTFTG